MAYRVTPDELKEIISTDLDDGVLNTFIKVANITVTEYLGDSTELDDDQLKEIERFLAAHTLASTREQQAISEGAKDARITYQGKTGLGLDSTFYGQQVKLLDTSGVLAGAIGRRKAVIYSVTSFE